MPTDIDARMAEEVVGWLAHDAIPNHFTLPFFLDGEITRVSSPFQWEPWSPSTDMNAAMEVVEKMRGRGLIIELNNSIYSREWEASFLNPDTLYSTTNSSDTPALAICLAALESKRQPR